jgi:integrase
VRELYQRKAGGVYWCEYHDPRQGRVRRSTKCKDRAAARLARQQFEREAHDPQRATEDAPTATVAEILENFVNGGCLDVADATLSMYIQKAGHLQRLLGERLAGDLPDISIVKSYIKTRQIEGAKSGTIYKELVTLRQALYGALEDKLITFDPRVCFPRFRSRYEPKDRWLTPEELVRLLHAFGPSDDPGLARQGSPHRQLWICLAVYTGGRDSEIDSIRWEDIDWRTKRIRLGGTKTEEADRWVPLLPPLEAVLKRSRQATGYIVGEWGNVRRDLHAACSERRANIPPCSPNDLRRTFATWLANMAVAENIVVALMGHTSSRMVRRVYAQLQPSLLADQMALLTGSCTTGVPKIFPAEADMAVVSAESLRKVAEILQNPVLGPGIEPGTRGFSVRVPVSKFANIGGKKRRCTTGVPKSSRRAG